jgi:hypothetical protein
MHRARPLRLSYSDIAAVEAAPRREWWWKTAYGLFGTRYFPYGRKPASAVRILLKEETATRTPKVITIGTDNAEELAELIRGRIEDHG